jgi:hypothetical protein
VDPLTILSVFAPLLVDAGKSAINRWLRSETYKPADINEFVKIKELELKTFEAVNNAGGSGSPSYPWVEAVIKLMRPFVTACVVGTWAYMHTYMPDVDHTGIDNAAGIVGFYLFGDRTLFYAKKKLDGG